MDIGKVLQDARVAKNLTLDRAAQETNIRKAYLEAIEQNDFAVLQGDVFVKGIMRTYGRETARLKIITQSGNPGM